MYDNFISGFIGGITQLNPAVMANVVYGTGIPIIGTESKKTKASCEAERSNFFYAQSSDNIETKVCADFLSWIFFVSKNKQYRFFWKRWNVENIAIPLKLFDCDKIL